jgi:hypothetical protein
MPKQTASKQQIDRLLPFYTKVIDSGFSADQLKAMNLKDYNKALGKNLKSENSLKGSKRLLDQIQNKIDAVESRYVKKHNLNSTFLKEALKERTSEHFRIKKQAEKSLRDIQARKAQSKRTAKKADELIKRANELLKQAKAEEAVEKKLKEKEAEQKHNKFDDIAKSIQKERGLTKKEAYRKTRDLLNVPRKDYRKLSKRDREVLSSYGY